MYDSVCVTGETVSPGHVATSLSISGFTGDSGVDKQIQNVLDCVTDIPPIATVVGGVAGVPNDDDIKRIRVRWPVSCCGIFSPLQSSCPYRSSATAHANICTLTLLFKSLMK